MSLGISLKTETRLEAKAREQSGNRIGSGSV